MHRLALVFPALLIPIDGTAQAVAVAPVVSSVGHKFLTNRTGWLMHLEVPLLDEVYLRLQFENSDGTGDHVGTVCGEPAAPTCEEESIDDRSGFRSTSLAVPIHMLSGSRLAFSIIPHVTGGRVWVRMTGRTTGEEMQSSRDFRGVGIGAELLLRAAATSPFSLTAGARHATLFPKRTRRPDVVHPLSREFSDNAAYIGVRLGR